MLLGGEPRTLPQVRPFDKGKPEVIRTKPVSLISFAGNRQAAPTD